MSKQHDLTDCVSRYGPLKQALQVEWWLIRLTIDVAVTEQETHRPLARDCILTYNPHPSPPQSYCV